MNIEFKVVNHAANLNRTLSFDSDGHNILTKFMNCNNPSAYASGIIAFINFVRIYFLIIKAIVFYSLIMDYGMYRI